MSYPTTCNKCHKTTWAGCGQHIDSVKAPAPRDQQSQGGIFSRLFG